MLGKKLFAPTIIFLFLTYPLPSWVYDDDGRLKVAIEYWVRPDTMSVCPHSIPQDQCVTISDLVSNATTGNASINGNRNITLNFLPGIHIPRESGWIIIGELNGKDSDVDVHVSAVVTGLPAQFNVSQGGVEQVLIDCAQGFAISFLFFRVSSLSLKHFEIQNCGYGLHLPRKEMSLLVETTTSIGVMNVPEMAASDITISNSLGVGLLVINFGEYEKWKLQIDHVMINGSNNEQNKEMMGGNAYILVTNAFTNAYKEKSSSSSIQIVNSNFSNGIGNCHERNAQDFHGCTSGGLAIVIDSFQQSIHLDIENCTFSNNQAIVGGGMIVLVKLEDYKSFTEFLHSQNLFSSFRFQSSYWPSFHTSTHRYLYSQYYNYGVTVRIIRSVFFGNTAITDGGAMYVSEDDNIGATYIKDTEIVISKTTFILNSAAKYGGAIFIVEYLYEVQDCIFSANKAKSGAAFYFRSKTRHTSQIKNSKFEGNSIFQVATTNSHGDTEGSVIVIHRQEGLLLSNVSMVNNTCRALYLFESWLTISGIVNIENNSAIKSDGGGIFFDCSIKITNSVLQTIHTSFLEFDEQTFNHLIVNGNKADGVGGGIAIRHSCGIQDKCFISTQVMDNTVVTMMDNTAKFGGNSVFGGNLENCPLSFWSKVYIAEINTSSAISSPPNKVCICSIDFPQTHSCSHSLKIRTFPGQIFQVPLVCVGQYNYSSPCIVRADLKNTNNSIADTWKVKDLGLECKNVSYSIDTFETEATVSLFLTIQDSIVELYNWEKKVIPVIIDVWIEACLPGFIQDSNTGKCICTSHLIEKGVTCSVTDGQLHKALSMWVGNYGGHVTAHQTCPFDYCKSNYTTIDPRNQHEQCNFNRTGILCGTCPPGLSLVLGTSQCKKCSNVYLLLLIPFALAGVVLIVVLLKCNLTVSTGTINGLIFYANIVGATQTTFYPANSNSKPIYVLSIFVAWLNLDLGIETCFVEGLNTYYKTWLQFVFPVYIWTLVGLLIVISRYSITVSKWTGSNTVSVLATLFLLSYAKLLRTTFDTFSPITLTNVNGTPTTLWLLDGRYQFLEWPHSLLFIVGLVTLLAHILPFTILLFMAPFLQRYSHHKPLRWVNKVKPLLDAYQGPYKNNIRYWSGLQLLIRLVILTAVALNVTRNKAVNLFLISLVLSLVLLMSMTLQITKVYRNKLQNCLELFFLGNLLVLTLSSQFLLSNKTHKIKGQAILTSCMVGSAFAVCLLILIYHCYNFCLKYPAFKKLIKRAGALSSKPQKETCHLDPYILTGSNTTSKPTFTIVELKEPLLEASS
ncbi:uncharacterized protein LOC135345963 [Halichondria panicea]|uniref:uncharacterized protein LOC135345963 n=1 Tax=Halichondria panicea TaxID=6063 RepID=UPI00312B97D8